MTTNMNLFGSGRSFSKTESKGNQMKECKNNYWYKTDFLGYEAASEWVSSKVLEGSGAFFVEYELVPNTNPVQCRSENFLENGESIVTVNRLFEKILGINIAKKCATMEVKASIEWFVNSLEEMTGLTGFGRYLSGMLALDTIILNEDRHFRNIAVIRSGSGFRFAPIFDNGAAFLSDCYSYPKGNTERNYLEDLVSNTEVKPFGHTFDEQLDACEELYGTPLQFNFVDVRSSELSKYYDDEVITRIDFVLRESRRKYKYLFKE